MFGGEKGEVAGMPYLSLCILSKDVGVARVLKRSLGQDKCEGAGEGALKHFQLFERNTRVCACVHIRCF